MERKKRNGGFGEIETEHPGYLGAQDTYYVGNIKGVGRIYQQTFIDTYSKVAFAKLYDRKMRSRQQTCSTTKSFLFEETANPLAPYFNRPWNGVLLGKAEYHEFELYLRIENIEHSKTKVKARKAMVSVNVFTEPSRMSSMLWLSERNCTSLWKNYSLILMPGSRSTTNGEHTPGSIVLVKHLGKLFWSPKNLQWPKW